MHVAYFNVRAEASIKYTQTHALHVHEAASSVHMEKLWALPDSFPIVTVEQQCADTPAKRYSVWWRARGIHIIAHCTQ